MFETYQLRKTVKGEGGRQPKYQIQNVNVKGQGQVRAKGQIHLIGYNFASSCHRDYKLGSYFKFLKSCTKYDLDLDF